MHKDGSSRAEGASAPIRSSAPPAAPTGYRTLLPTLPTGKLSENSVFLHGDPSARPYKIDDVAAALSAVTDLKKITGLGPFQFNHVWMVTFQSSEEMKELASRGEIEAKGKRCLVIDPNNQEKTVKLHWVPTTVPNELLVHHLERFGAVKSVSSEKWRRPNMDHMGSTTRVVQIVPRDATSLDAIPYQVTIYGNPVLIEVPGRPAMCLRCQMLGHMRRQCTTPWCRVCRTFGHDSTACVQSYAAKAKGKRAEQPLDEFMDIAEIQETVNPQPSSQAKGIQPAKGNERNDGPANVSPPDESVDIGDEKEGGGPDLPLKNDAPAAPCPLLQNAAGTEQEPAAEEPREQEINREEKDAAPVCDSCPSTSAASQGERRIETRRQARAKQAATTPDGQEGKRPTTKDALPRNPEQLRGERKTSVVQAGGDACPTGREDTTPCDNGSGCG